jgi:hypothetical protein
MISMCDHRIGSRDGDAPNEHVRASNGGSDRSASISVKRLLRLQFNNAKTELSSCNTAIEATAFRPFFKLSVDVRTRPNEVVQMKERTEFLSL